MMLHEFLPKVEGRDRLNLFIGKTSKTLKSLRRITC